MRIGSVLIISILFSRYDQPRQGSGPAIFSISVTVLVQFYCNIHIIYCKWRLYKEENERFVSRRVPDVPPQILLNDRPISNSAGFRENSPRVINQNINLNTISYNKILTDMKHILCLFAFVIFFLITKSARHQFTKNMDWRAINNEYKIIPYILDFGSKILLSVLFPLIFYISHKDLRTYWKNSFIFCRTNQA